MGYIQSILRFLHWTYSIYSMVAVDAPRLATYHVVHGDVRNYCVSHNIACLLIVITCISPLIGLTLLQKPNPPGDSSALKFKGLQWPLVVPSGSLGLGLVHQPDGNNGAHKRITNKPFAKVLKQDARMSSQVDSSTAFIFFLSPQAFK